MRVRAERRSIELPSRGVVLSMLDFGGEGPLALLHHANGFCAALWEPVALELRARFRVLALDARGHGDSSAPPPPRSYHWLQFADDLVALVDRLVADGACERIGYGVGHSFGGTMMAAAASRRPERFARLAMVDPVILPPPEMAFPPRAYSEPPLSERALARRRTWPSFDAVLESWSQPGHAFSSWSKRSLELYVREGFRELADGSVELKCAPEVESAVFSHNQSMSPFEFASGVRAPTRILWAKRGNFPRPIYEALAARMADATIEDLDAGHLVVMEDPALVARRLLAFAATP
jgi:pimeloyl-ACP methyl ester carboxylesterase